MSTDEDQATKKTTERQQKQGYALHAYCQLWPPMPEEALRALGDDIRDNGLQQKLVLYQGQLLDGRNRYLGCKLIGYDLPDDAFTTFEGTDEEALTLVVGANNKRRHMTPDDLTVVYVKVSAERKRLAAGKAKREANLIPDAAHRVPKLERGHGPLSSEALAQYKKQDDSARLRAQVATEVGIGDATAKRIDYVMAHGPQAVKDDLLGKRTNPTRAYKDTKASEAVKRAEDTTPSAPAPTDAQLAQRAAWAEQLQEVRRRADAFVAYCRSEAKDAISNHMDALLIRKDIYTIVDAARNISKTIEEFPNSFKAMRAAGQPGATTGEEPDVPAASSTPTVSTPATTTTAHPPVSEPPEVMDERAADYATLRSLIEELDDVVVPVVKNRDYQSLMTKRGPLGEALEFHDLWDQLCRTVAEMVRRGGPDKLPRGLYRRGACAAAAAAANSSPDDDPVAASIRADNHAAVLDFLRLKEPSREYRVLLREVRRSLLERNSFSNETRGHHYTLDRLSREVGHLNKYLATLSPDLYSDEDGQHEADTGQATAEAGAAQ